MLWPLPVRATRGLIGLAGERVPNSDISIFLWDFWWVERALFRLNSNPFYCDVVGRPGPDVFVFPTLSFVNSLAAVPLSSLFGRESAYNILIIIILAFAAAATYLLAFDITRAWLPSVLAGAMVASSPLLIRHAGQINVFSVAWTPFALWAARRFLASGRAWWAVAFGLAYLLNLLSSWYHAVALTLLVAMLSAIKLWQNRAERARA